MVSMRFMTIDLALRCCLVAFSGCLGIFEDEARVSAEDGPDENQSTQEVPPHAAAEDGEADEQEDASRSHRYPYP